MGKVMKHYQDLRSWLCERAAEGPRGTSRHLWSTVS
jgi:hypothetical protein